MPVYKLHYFDIRARAEVARILMAYGDIKYEDIRYSGEEWEKFKPNTPYGALPVLEVDGKMYCQTPAIGRFLANQVGLNGKTDLDRMKIDMVIGCMDDFFIPQVDMLFEKDEAVKAEKMKKFGDELEGNLKKIEAMLEGDYVVGNQLSWADITISEGLLFAESGGHKLPMDKVPKLAALKDKVNKHPKIAPWIAKRPKTPM